MKSTVLKAAAAAALMAGASPAFADLIYVNGVQHSGTGLGAVSTVVTVQDNNKGGKDNGVESGCVTYNSANPAKPGETCPVGLGLQGGDNTAGSAGNNTYLLSNIAGLTSAGQLGFVVNISEGAPANTATLTDLYMSLFNTSSSLTTYFQYTGPDLVLGDSGGIGQSGKHRFILDDAQALAAATFCPVLTQCVVGGGIQFGFGTTESTPETVYVGAFEREGGGGNPGGGELPEPGSIALLGAGALAFRAMRRRTAKK